MKWREEMKVGVEVEVREAVSSSERPRWLRAIVRAVGKMEDNGVVRDCAGGAELELFDADELDEEEGVRQRRPLLLLKRTQQVRRGGVSSIFSNLFIRFDPPSLLLQLFHVPHLRYFILIPHPYRNFLKNHQVLVEVPDERSEFPLILPAAKTSSPTNRTDTPTAPVIAAQPPFIRWVYLYGEELCERNTHIKSHLVDDLEISTAKTVHGSTTKTRVPMVRPQSTHNHQQQNNNNEIVVNRESRKGVVPPAPGSVGFHNLGNSCYMNSVLQCLNRIEPLTDYFLKGMLSEDINENNPLGSGGRIAKSYAAVRATRSSRI